MKNNMTTPGLIMALAASAWLVGCRATSEKRGESETAPEGTTALEPAYRGLPKSGPVSFAHHIKPILESKCLPCHSPPYGENGFRLDSREHAFASGANGARIIPGRPDQSLLLSLSTTHAGVAVMPKVGNRVTRTESQLLRQWIIEGAPWPKGRAGDLFPAENWLEKD